MSTGRGARGMIVREGNAVCLATLLSTVARLERFCGSTCVPDGFVFVI